MLIFNDPIDLGAYQPPTSDLGDRLQEIGDVGLFLQTSYVPDITSSIRRAIADSKTKLIHVDLGNGHRWWHTRLFLVAALAEDYARIGALVFHADRDGRRRCFVGTASPGAARLALAAVTPDLQVAYSAGQREAATQQPQPVPLHSVEAVEGTVAGFGLNLPAPEPLLKIDVSEELLRRWLGPALVTESLPSPAELGAAIPRRDLPVILARREPYVALTSDQRLVQVVDRDELASRLALDALGPSG